MRVGQACLRRVPLPRPAQASSPVRLCPQSLDRLPLGWPGLWAGPASGPAVSLMKVRDVMFMSFTRVNPLFVPYHSHTTDGRGPGGNGPRLEQPQLISLLENDLLGGWFLIGRCAQYQELSRRPLMPMTKAADTPPPELGSIWFPLLSLVGLRDLLHRLRLDLEV